MFFLEQYNSETGNWEPAYYGASPFLEYTLLAQQRSEYEFGWATRVVKPN